MREKGEKNRSWECKPKFSFFYLFPARLDNKPRNIECPEKRQTLNRMLLFAWGRVSQRRDTYYLFLEGLLPKRTENFVPKRGKRESYLFADPLSSIWFSISTSGEDWAIVVRVHHSSRVSWFEYWGGGGLGNRRSRAS